MLEKYMHSCTRRKLYPVHIKWRDYTTWSSGKIFFEYSSDIQAQFAFSLCLVKSIGVALLWNNDISTSKMFIWICVT